jgi:predicted dehydrogenase
MNNTYTAIVIGYGSIGKRHARIVNDMVTSMIILDKKEEVRKQAKLDHPEWIVAANLEDLENLEFVNWERAYATIATWDPSHAIIYNRFADLGVKKILCEKPMASSVYDAYKIKCRAEREDILLSVNQYIRFSNYTKSLTHFCTQHKLGEIELVLISGGAACIATNGIHWIDLAMQLIWRRTSYGI